MRRLQLTICVFKGFSSLISVTSSTLLESTASITEFHLLSVNELEHICDHSRLSWRNDAFHDKVKIRHYIAGVNGPREDTFRLKAGRGVTKPREQEVHKVDLL